MTRNTYRVFCCGDVGDAASLDDVAFAWEFRKYDSLGKLLQHVYLGKATRASSVVQAAEQLATLLNVVVEE